MATREAIKQVLNEAVMGNEEAIDELAAYMEGQESQAAESQAQSLVQQQLAQLQGQKAYLKKVLEWARNNPDVAYDDESYVHAVEVDANLAKAYPEMSEERRLTFAADITREELGDAETRDNSDAIASVVGKNRSYVSPRKAARDTSGEAELDDERSGIIQQMQIDRENLRNSAANAYRIRKDPDGRR